MSPYSSQTKNIIQITNYKLQFKHKHVTFVFMHVHDAVLVLDIIMYINLTSVLRRLQPAS